MNIKSFKVKASLLQGVETMAAIDRGGSLTKFIYVSSLVTEEECYTFHAGYCVNSQFEAALHHVKEHAILPEEGIIPISGLGGDTNRVLIESILKLKPHFCDEFHSHAMGAYFLRKNFQDAEFCYPASEIPYNLCYEAEWAADMMKSILAKYTVKGMYPFLFCVTGSAHVVQTINEDGTAEISGMLLPGGNTYISLCRLLLGTRDYDAVEKMSIAGDRRKVDTLMGELAQINPDSPYGVYPADLPVFAFGKAFAQDRGVADFKQEDLARSLVSFSCMNLFTYVNAVAQEKGIKNIYFGGNMVNGESMRIELQSANIALGQGSPLLNVQCIQYGQTACLGAMLLSSKK